MTEVVETLRKAGQSEKFNKHLPAVYVKGRSMISKLSTIKALNGIIAGMGSLNDFNCSRKHGLKFYIETSSRNILPIIRQMQVKNCLQYKKITNRKIGLDDNELKLNLLITLQVNRFQEPYIQKEAGYPELEIRFHNHL